MNRLSYITDKNLTEAQQTLFDHVLNGKRGSDKPKADLLTQEGGLIGPFNAWLRSPVLGDAAQRLGEAVRFESSLSPMIRELAILLVAAKWRCQYEWWAHERIGRKAGLDDTLMESIRKGELPAFNDPAEKIVYDFTRELIETREVSDALYDEAVKSIGETAVVDLVILAGYYTMVSMTLNVFQVPVPPGEASPFE